MVQSADLGQYRQNKGRKTSDNKLIPMLFPCKSGNRIITIKSLAPYK